MKDNSLIAPGYAESRKFGIGPDFAVYTGTPKTAGIIAIPEADAKRPIVQMCGSSTIMDLQGDIMALTALQDMTQLDPEFLIFTDHSYNLDNIFGKLYGQPIIQMQNTIADLWLAAEAALDHPPAERAYNLIMKSKLRLGCSIGCMVLDYEFLDEDDFFSPVIIHHVKCMEFSLVGIPANQRCWVENAIKGLFGRNLVEGNGDEALKLAPAFKGLYPRDYASVVEQITSAGLRKEMQRIPMRSTHPQKIMYDFTEAREGFILSDSKGIVKSLSREETADLLQNGASLHTTTKAVGGNTGLPLLDIGTEWTGSRAEKEIFAQAEGDDGNIQVSKAKPGFLWYDPDKADKRGGYKMPFCYVSGGMKIVPLGVRACANVLNGGMGGGKFGGDDAAMKAKCKTMYGRINSQFKPDPPWQVPWEKKEDSANPETVLAFDHVTINGVTYAFDEENNAFLPWVSKDGVLDTESGNDLIRQDLEEEGQVDEDEKTKGVKVSADGTHEPFTGTHTHAHKSYGAQGSDDLHEHEHDHDGDADHGHSHADGKSEEPDAQKAGGGIHINDDGSHEKMTGSHTHSHPNYGAKADGSMHSHEHEHKNDADHHHAHSDGKSAGVQVDEDGNHQPFTGNHTHAHKAFGGPDDNNDGKHSHAHDHDGDSNHKHSHADQKAAGEPHSHDGVEHTHEAPDAVTLAYLAMFNDLGKKLGFPEHTLTTKCDLVANDGDAGIVRSVLAALDDCSDAAMELAQRTDGYVDQLMAMMSVPDTNDGEALPGVPGYYSLQHSLSSIQYYLTTKEGREISGKNAAIHQQIHDLLHAMHPDGTLCKNGPMGDQLSGDGTAHQSEGISVEEARQQAANMGQGQPSEYMNTDSLTALNNLAKSFESFNVKAVVEASVKQAVDAAITDARKNLELLNREQQVLMDNIAKLKNMPLGNPTRLNRTVVQDERAASYEDMLSVNQQQKTLPGPSQTLAEALAQTSVVKKSVYLNGQETETRYRHWPEGVGGPVGKGVRPALTNDQKTFMMPHEWGIYNIGGAVDVPLVDDPAEVAV